MCTCWERDTGESIIHVCCAPIRKVGISSCAVNHVWFSLNYVVEIHRRGICLSFVQVARYVINPT